MTKECNLDVIVEVANQQDIEIAMKHTKTPLIGVNNRDLKTFSTDISNTVNMLRYIDKTRTVICESGIKTPDDVSFIKEAGIHSF